MRPHAQNLDNTLFLQHLIDKTVLDVDSTRDCSLQIANKHFIRWRSLKGINGKDTEQPPNIWTQASSFP